MKFETNPSWQGLREPVPWINEISEVIDLRLDEKTIVRQAMIVLGLHNPPV